MFFCLFDFANTPSFKTIHVVDSGRNIALTHAASIHCQHFIFDVGYVALVFGQNHRFKRGLTVTRHFYCCLTPWSFDSLVEITVTPIRRLFFLTGIWLVTEVTFHFAIKYRLKHRSEDFFESRLHFGDTLGLVLGCVGKLKMANKSGKKNEIQETSIELVESDCDVTKFFHALEKAFDNVTLFVKLSIEIR